MSKNLILIAILTLGFFASAFAQSPGAFNYQALVRDASGQVQPHTQVTFRITLHDPAQPTLPAYTETHQVTTDAFGRVALRVGEGEPESGVFADLDWPGGRYEIKVERRTPDGHDFELLGSAPLVSVPYALHARTVEFDQVDDADADPKNEIQHLRLMGDTLHITQGNYVVLPPAMSGSPEDVQTLSLNDATLSISGGNSVDLSDLEDSDFTLGRGNSSSITKVLTIEGKRINGPANGNFAEIQFMNNDDYNYVGAKIASANTDGDFDGDLRFYTYDGSLTQQMVITNKGYVGFGTDNPQYHLDVVKEKDGGFIARFRNTQNTNGSPDEGILIRAGHDSYNSNRQSSFIQFETPDGSYCGRVKQDGGSSVNYYDASDRRLKENISDTHYGLDDVLKIRVRDYNYIGDGPGQQCTGFIAQELYEVYPVAVDMGGEDVQTEPWAVSYGMLTPVLVQAVQDQQELIEAQMDLDDDQEEKLDAHEAELEALLQATTQLQSLEARLKTLESSTSTQAGITSK